MSTRPPSHPPGYRKDSYPMSYRCTNCKKKFMVYIEKGVRAPAKVDKPCPNCGCKTLWIT